MMQVPRPVTRPWSYRSRFACIGSAVIALVVAPVVLVFGFGDSLLNGYIKNKIEQSFAESNPGSTLQLGRLDYDREANRLTADTITLLSADSRLRAGPVSVLGVRWALLLQGSGSIPELLARATVDAANLSVEFPKAQYVIRCRQLRASVPGSTLAAHRVELRPLLSDEEFFARDRFRSTRFSLSAPSLTALGVAYPEALAGKSFRAVAVHLSQPAFDAFVNREKPVRPASMKRRLMLHEALATVPKPFQIDSLSVTNGLISYRERVVAGSQPGVLTFGSVNVAAKGITNRGRPSAAILVDAAGSLMNAGTLKVHLSVPIHPADFSLSYSGSLGPMDLTRLNGFLEIPEHTRVTSGRANMATFDIQVRNGHARGWVRGTYDGLRIAVLDKQTGTEQGLDNRVASLVANTFKVRNANGTDKTDPAKVGQVRYTRKAEDGFLKFLWVGLRTGVLDLISH